MFYRFAVIATVVGALTASLAAIPSTPQPVTIEMSWLGLAGSACEGGTIGPVDGFDVGRYIVASDNLVLRATAEVENKPPLGSLEGNEADLYLTQADDYLGVGSIADVGKPGSDAISGGGPHGSEIVHMIFNGDPMVVSPKEVPANSVVIQIADYDTTKSKLSLVLHSADGQMHVFPPSVVEPLMTAIGSDAFELNSADLPGIDSIPVLDSFDVRSGWFDTTKGKLTGGHFWLTSVTFTPEPVSPRAFESYD